MKKLISMTDYCFEQTSLLKIGNPDDFVRNVSNYAKFLRQPLKLGMFVPCDENDVPLDEPEHYELWRKYGDFTQYGTNLTLKCRPYKEAKDRVLFDGFKLGFHKESIYLESDTTFCLDLEILSNNCIEDIAKYNLTLTENALKQIEL